MKSKKLIFAVQLKDEFTTRQPLAGRYQVDLIGRKEKAIKNNSGLYCFGGLAPGIYSIAVRARFYCDRTVEVDTLSLDPKLHGLDEKGRKSSIIVFPDLRDLSRYEQHALKPGDFFAKADGSRD